MWQPNLAQNRVCASNNYADQVDCFKWEAAAAEEGARRGLSCTSEGAPLPARICRHLNTNGPFADVPGHCRPNIPPQNVYGVKAPWCSVLGAPCSRHRLRA